VDVWVQLQNRKDGLWLKVLSNIQPRLTIFRFFSTSRGRWFSRVFLSFFSSRRLWASPVPARERNWLFTRIKAWTSPGLLVRLTAFFHPRRSARVPGALRVFRSGARGYERISDVSGASEPVRTAGRPAVRRVWRKGIQTRRSGFDNVDPATIPSRLRRPCAVCGDLGCS
jgi:hypothetical protein